MERQKTEKEDKNSRNNRGFISLTEKITLPTFPPFENTRQKNGREKSNLGLISTLANSPMPLLLSFEHFQFPSG